MNYPKKRKRQNGRQDGNSPSQSCAHYQRGFYDGQSELISRLVEAGILPKVDFKPMAKDS